MLLDDEHEEGSRPPLPTPQPLVPALFSDLCIAPPLDTASFDDVV